MNPRRVGVRRRVLITLVLLIVILVTAAVAYWRSLQSAPLMVGQTATQNVSEATPIGGGSGEIAFISKRDGNWEIYAMSADGSDLRNLSDNPAQDWFPSYALDSQQMNLLSTRSGDTGPVQMKPDGSDQQTLTVLGAIFTLFQQGRFDWDPKWSPDGKRLLWVSLRDLNLELYLTDDGGKTRTRLTNNPAYDWYPAWSPDGKRIAFATNRDGNEEIYVMNADGTDQRRLTNTPDDELNPVWSLDGKQIAFMSEREHPLMSGALDIFAAGAAGGEAHKITKDTVFEGGAVWSPDGNSAAYMSNKEGEWNIYRMKADGSSVRRLTDSSADDLFPIWRP